MVLNGDFLSTCSLLLDVFKCRYEGPERVDFQPSLRINWIFVGQYWAKQRKVYVNAVQRNSLAGR